MASVSCERLGGADLISDQPLDLAKRDGNAPPSKTPQVRKTWMCADRDAFILSQTKSAGHDLRIAGVKAAGDVRR